MTFAAVAIGGGALVATGIGTQAYFGNKARGSAKRAARAAAAEAARARAAALGYQKPYYQSGTAGLNNLTGLLTGSQYDQQGNKTTLSDQQRSDLFSKSPGYQFRLEQGQKALEASQAARGGMLSGGAMKEMNQYSQGIASGEYGNYINQLQGLAGIGQNAANTMSNIEIGQGNQIAGYSQQAGMADANYYQGLGNSIGGGMQSIGGTMLGGGLANLNPTPAPPGTGGSNWNAQSNSPNFNTQLSRNW